MIRIDQPEPRWQVILALFAVTGIHLALPKELVVGPGWLLPVGLLLVLPWLLSASVHPSMLVFIVVYGLDWVATVPPTAALCRRAFGTDGTIVFGWVFASHQIGAAGLCVVAAAVSFGIRRRDPVLV